MLGKSVTCLKGLSAPAPLAREYELSVCETVRSLLKRLSRDRPLNLALYSSRSDSFDFQDLVDENCASVGNVAAFGCLKDLEASQTTYDVALVCNHIMNEQVVHSLVRSSRLAPLILSWTFDNHHHEAANIAMTEHADMVLPAHTEGCEALSRSGRILGPRFPLATRQWTRQLAAEVVNKSIDTPRSDLLYGGYFKHRAGTRSTIIEDIMTDLAPTALSLRDPSKRESYFGRTPEQNIREWCTYKVHLSMPLLNDLSTRCFDSLICGQIPLVPRACTDLDLCITESMQDALPIIRFDDVTPQVIAKAHRAALERFDRDGMEGILRRHEFASKRHHIAVRIGEIATYLQNCARRLEPAI